MTKETLIKKYNKLEQQVHNKFRKRIAKSIYLSKYYDVKVLRVNIYDYTELAVIDDKLVFLNSNGYQHSIDNGDCTLLDLIELL